MVFAKDGYDEYIRRESHKGFIFSNGMFEKEDCKKHHFEKFLIFLLVLSFHVTKRNAGYVKK